MVKERRPSALYQRIEELQADAAWGSVLDAGTGANSLRWLASLPTERWTAVTGSEAEARIASEAVGDGLRGTDEVVVGNWADSTLLAGRQFNTVIADYLLGAIEGFAPYFQTYLFGRLRPLTGLRLYLTGLEPYVPTGRPADRGAELIWELGRFRDACVLLKGGMPYREYPAGWVGDQLRRSAFEVRDVKHFAVGYKQSFVKGQINIALHALDQLPDQALAQSLRARGEVLKEEALAWIASEGALRGCRNYVMAAEPA